jgi:hypothetical protein
MDHLVFIIFIVIVGPNKWISLFLSYHCDHRENSVIAIVGRCFHSRRMLIGFLVTKHQKVRILIKRIKKFPITTLFLSLLLQGQQLKIRSSDHLKQGILGVLLFVIL